MLNPDPFGSTVAAMGELQCLIYPASPESGNVNILVSTVTSLLPHCANVTLLYPNQVQMQLTVIDTSCGKRVKLPQS